MFTRIAAALALVLTLASVGAAFETYKEAFDAANAQYAKADFATAETSINEAIKLAANPEEKTKALNQLVLIQNRAGKVSEALATADQIIQMPDAPAAQKNNAYRVKIEVLWSRQRLDEALVACKALLEYPDISPTMKTNAILYTARICQRQNKFDEAITEADKVMNGDWASARDKIEAIKVKGTALHSKKDYEGARAEFNKIGQAEGSNSQDKAQMYFGLGRAFAAETKINEAAAEFNKVAALEVNDATKLLAQRELAYILYTAKQYDAAKAAYEKALTIPGVTEPVKKQIESMLERIAKESAPKR